MTLKGRSVRAYQINNYNIARVVLSNEMRNSNFVIK